MWVITIVVGLLLASVTIGSIIKGKKSKNWPSTSATVTSSAVEVRREYDEEGENIYYYPHVYYEYHVNGISYKGNRIKLLETSMSNRKAQIFISNFNQGDNITIFYDSNRPGDSVIQTGEQKYLYVFLIIGIGLVIFSAIKLIG